MRTSVPVPHLSRLLPLPAPLMACAIGCLAAAGTLPAVAADTDSNLQEVVVTGSLIPTTQQQTFTPMMTITNEDIQAKGFSDVAEALQRLSYSTGSIQNAQFEGFTQGAKVVSFFGLDPSYTKYLINGQPMANYPALYNGTESFVSISGIPTVLIDHVDVLPGAQSSIYGSDAIAGVVNMVMKTHMDGLMIDGRYGFYDDGGGADRRIAIGDGFTLGNFNLVAGLQYENSNPIWGYQRDLTKQFYNQGSTPQTAERDYLVIGVFGQPTGLYYFEDPANCANVASQWSHTTHLANRPGSGTYCGTLYDGAYTNQNADEQTQFYGHATYDVNDAVQIYADTLLSHDVVRFSVGPNGYSSDEDSSSPFAYFEDPRLGPDYLNLQHIFSPEESGGLNDTFDKNTNNSVRGTLGIKGAFGSSWKWLADATWTDNKLTEATHLFFTQPIEAFFSNIYGPQLGFDPALGAYEYQPNYGNFYKPVTAAQYASFSGYASNYSYTEESLVRAQITNSDLFALPGGKAGMALQAEGGDQGWNYAPDPRYFDNQTFGYTSTAGSGHRSRYAGTAEMNLPLFPMLKADLSGRYDDYRVEGDNVDKFTYNISLEFQPIHEITLRGRYGTAFKAPTLGDEFQGLSGFYQGLTDYYTCYKSGYTAATIGNCPQYGLSVFGSTSGNPKLQPITAKVFDLGLIVAPVERLSLTFDWIRYSISNEVATTDANKLLETEAACRLGQLAIGSPTCVAALADVTRDVSGALISVYTPKQNLSRENLGVIIPGLTYLYDAGAYGKLAFDVSYTDTLLHTYQQFPGDPFINDLNDPFYSTEFKTKADATVTWTLDPISITAYVERYGKSPNYISQEIPEGYSLPGAGDVAPWTLADFSVRYHPLKSLELSVAINNAFNKMPPADHSQPGITNQPYNEFNYNVYGREFFLQFTYRGGTK
jgi:iron complex outermembrane receptor protein